MKRIICILFFSLLISHLYAEDNQQISKYSPIIESIFTEIEGLINNTSDSDILRQTFTISHNAILSGSIPIRLDNKEISILSGASLNIFVNGSAALSISPKLLDLYPQKKSIVFSIIMHELKHIHDFLTKNKAYMGSKEDIKESLWYELDAMYIESIFIEKCLSPNMELTRFETYFLKSWQQDKMNSITLFLKNESRRIFFIFVQLEDDYNNNEYSRQEVYHELIKLGDSLLLNHTDKISEYKFENYTNYIEINTYYNFLKRLINVIEYGKLLTWADIFSEYPEIQKIISNCETITSSEIDPVNTYRNYVLSIWETDIITF